MVNFLQKLFNVCCGQGLPHIHTNRHTQTSLKQHFSPEWETYNLNVLIDIIL